MKIVMVAGIIVAAVCYGQTAQRERGFSVRDSIEMNTFSEPTALDPKAVAPTSPNRKYFVVVTSRGNLKSDKVESTLYLFSRADVERFVRDEKVGAEPPQPLRLVTIAAIPSVNSYLPYSPVISDITWAPDSSAVYFLADQGDSRRRLCSVEVHSRSLHCLTPDSYDVERYRVSRGTIVYTATHAANGSGEDDFQSDSGAIPIRGMSITRILFPGSSLKPRIHELWYLRRGHLHRVRQHSKSSELDLLHYWDVLSISPGERYIVQIKPVAAVKPAWEAYVPEIGKEDWKIDSGNRRETSPSNIFRARQYVLVDLLTGESCPLIDAPYADVLGYIESFQAVWSSDEKRLLLTNTFLPLEGSPERESRLRPCAVASVDLPSKQVHCVAFTRSSGERAKHSPNALTLDDASFGATGDEAALRLHDEAGGILREIYRFDGHAWSLIESRNQGENDKETSRSTALYIKQNLNDPPVLCARTASGGTKQIWNPNPQFSSIRFSTASVYHWVDDTGFKWTGGLVMPLDYVPGRRYPLVIQTHGFADFAFITDGIFPTAMAARPLATEGIVVLQVLGNSEHVGMAREANDNVRGYASAIERLSTEGIVDPNRVGIVGFSRTCWYVESALLDLPSAFAAASINDGIDHSYMQTMLFDLDRTSEGEEIYGAKPFGRGLKEWVNQAPTFHLDKVQAPVIITAITPGSVLQEWEIYSSLYRQKKPVDFLYFPKGQHILQRPSNRLASQQGTVDWFLFWLEGREDRNDPAKQDEYDRWVHLRELQKAGATASADPSHPSEEH